MIKTGQKFNKLVAVSKSSRRSTSGNYYWWFKCDCGNFTETLPANVRKSKNGVVSCGCVQKSRHHGKAWLSSMIYDYKKHAKKLGVKYNISREQFEQLVFEPCRYCGKEPRNGIDRLDSFLGYILENCVPCCKVCNYMKRKMSAKEFLQHVKKIYTVSSVV